MDRSALPLDMHPRLVTAALALLLLSLRTTDADAQAFNFDSPIGVVMRLYHDYSYQAAIDQIRVPYNDLLNEPRRVLEKYFDSGLTRLVLSDRKCAAKYGGICNIDWMAIWDSQDASGVTVSIEAGRVPTEVVVTLHSPDASSEELIYKIVKTKRGYRIHDIQCPGRSLIEVLKGTDYRR